MFIGFYFSIYLRNIFVFSSALRWSGSLASPGLAMGRTQLAFCIAGCCWDSAADDPCRDPALAVPKLHRNLWGLAILTLETLGLSEKGVYRYSQYSINNVESDDESMDLGWIRCIPFSPSHLSCSWVHGRYPVACLSLEESLGVPWAVICTWLSVIVLSDSDLAESRHCPI